MLLASVVQPNTHLSCVSVTLQAVDEYVFKSALADLSPLRLRGFIDQRTMNRKLKCCYFPFEVTAYYGPRAGAGQKISCGLALTGRAVSY